MDLTEDGDDYGGGRRNQWHLQKGVPISIILALLIQSLTVGWWASNMSVRVDILERQNLTMSTQAERIARLEERMTSIQEGVSEIKSLLKSPIR